MVVCYRMSDVSPVHVIGAAGRSGAALCRALLAQGTPVVPVVRDAQRWAATGMAGAPVVADLTEPLSLATALGGARRGVSTAHARHASAVLEAAATAERLVFLGSTRKFTRWPDAHGDGVLAGERAVLGSDRSAVMLHPTMIYGAEGENNVRRLAALIRRLPVLPMPGGGRALVQPIHQSDVTRSVMAAIELGDVTGPETMAPRVVSVPLSLLVIAAKMLGGVPLGPRVGADEVRRLAEDKDFDVGPMRERLGVVPITLEEGLALTFAG